MSKKKNIVIALMGGCALLQSAKSQSQLELTIQQFNDREVTGYVQPLGDFFGANMNAGFYHASAIPANGFHFEIELIGVASVIGEQHKVYDAALPAGFTPAGGSYKTATVFGGKGTVFRDASSGLEYKGSDGLVRASIFPLLIPQATIGSIFGTEIVFRFMKTPQLSQRWYPTESTLLGGGIRHSISQYFSNPEVDIAIGGFYSTFELGDVIHVQAKTITFSAGKTFSLVTLYVGMGYEWSTMHLHYDYKGEGGSTPRLADVTIEGANRFRATGGLMIDLQAFRIFADANFGNVQHFAGGIGFGF